MPMYLLAPIIVDNMIFSGSPVSLAMFIGCTCFAVSVMGGANAILPPYQSDLFGSKYVGANHGLMLMYSSCASLAYPNILIYLRSFSEKTAISDLVQLISPENFQASFGSSADNLAELCASKIVTINKLMTLVPPGTVDPSPHLYDSTMLAMTSLMTIAAMSHMLVKSVSVVNTGVILGKSDLKDIADSMKSFATTPSLTNRVSKISNKFNRDRLVTKK